jgi:phosphoglycolate phosphatase-like HAD superfamily hydrolase
VVTLLILFDIDGTLVLTGGAGVRALTRAFHDTFQIGDAFRGVPMPGRTDQMIVSEALQRLRLDADDDLLARFRDRYYECLVGEIQQPGPRKGIMPGVRELLDVLEMRSDVILGLLTGNYAESARIKLEHFDLWRYFRCGAFADDHADRNELVPVAVDRARACGVASIDPRDVIVIGDTPADVACAAAAGARSIAVATGGYDIGALRATGADVTLEDLSDTTEVLRLLDLT